MSDKNQFSKYANSYNSYNIIQQLVAKSIVRELQSKPKLILELGCGSGQIYKYIDWEVEHYHAIDASASMCELHPKGKNIQIECCDFDSDAFFDAIKDQHYEMVLSSSALQWSSNLPKIIKALSGVTSEIHAALFTSNTFKTIQELSNKPSPILDENTIKEAFSKFFECTFELLNYKLLFDNKKELFDYIKKSGVSSSSSLGFKEAKKLYKEYPLNYLEFEVLFVKAKKSKTE
ncbi:MAG: methyltransferase domain-containing protein [Arcobacteraceae bacterium]